MQKLLTPRDVQAILGLKKSAVYAMMASGEIPSVSVTKSRKRRSLRVIEADLENWIRNRELAA